MIAFLVRLVISALVLLGTAWLVPGFRVGGFLNASIAALVIAGIEYLLFRAGTGVRRQARGFVAFLVAAAVIWGAQFLVPAMQVTIVGALLAALVIGLADYLVPTLI